MKKQNQVFQVKAATRISEAKKEVEKCLDCIDTPHQIFVGKFNKDSVAIIIHCHGTGKQSSPEKAAAKVKDEVREVIVDFLGYCPKVKTVIKGYPGKGSTQFREYKTFVELFPIYQEPAKISDYIDIAS